MDVPHRFFLFPDYRGGFHLQPVQDTLRDCHLIEELERLRLSGQQSGHVPPSRAFTPLLDVPVDGYTSVNLRPRSLSPLSPLNPLSPLASLSSSFTESPHSTQRGRSPHRSPSRAEDRLYAEIAPQPAPQQGERPAPERGRSPVRKSHVRARREASPDSVHRHEGYTEVSVRVPSQRRGRTPLADIFEPQRDKSPAPGGSSGQQLNGHTQNGHGMKRRASPTPEEYEINTLSISKAKQSLGEHFNMNLH